MHHDIFRQPKTLRDICSLRLDSLQPQQFVYGYLPCQACPCLTTASHHHSLPCRMIDSIVSRSYTSGGIAVECSPQRQFDLVCLDAAQLPQSGFSYPYRVTWGHNTRLSSGSQEVQSVDVSSFVDRRLMWLERYNTVRVW